MIKLNSRRLLCFLMAPALLAAACTSSTEGAENTSTSTETPLTTAVLDTTTTEQPVDSPFKTTECDLGLGETVAVVCGNLEVPANWETGEGSFSIAVAVLTSTSDSPAADPVIYLDGGPGSHALDTMQFRMDDFFGPLAERGDVVVFDQRGAGRSEPAASCDEFDSLLEDEARAALKATPEDFAQSAIDALTECGERLRSEGVAVDDLNTTNNARDVEAIREALGYDSVNLLGISYGTRLGLEVVRLFPDTTRSLILDSVFPHQVDAAVDNAGSFATSLDAVVEACAAEAECAAQGDLGDRIEAAVAKLEEVPFEVDIVNFTDGSSDTIFVDGDALLSLINGALYSAQSFADFPELMTGIETDDPNALSLFASVDAANADFLTTGMFLGIACADEYAFSDPAEVLAALPEDPFGLVSPELAANSTFDQCNAFTGAVSDPVMDEPVSSDVPTLVMAGQFDPATPVAWAELAAETLPNSQYVLFPGESHGVSPTKCGLQVVQQFLAAPTDSVDSGCADDFVPTFIAGPGTPVSDFESIDVSVGGAPATVVVPTDWTHTEDGFVSDARRGLSLLDSAELLQFAGPDAVVLSVDTTLEGQFAGDFSEPTDVEIGGEVWSKSTFTSGDVAVTSLKTTRDGNTVVLYMFSTPIEHAELVDTVLLEAATGFQLR